MEILQRALRAKENAAEALEEQLSSVQALLSRQMEENAALRSRFADNEGALVALKEELAENEETLAALKEELADSASQIHALQSELAPSANAAAALERQLSGDQQLFARKLQELSDLRSELSAKDGSMAALEAQLVEAQAALAAEAVQREAYEMKSGVIVARETQATAREAGLNAAAAPLMQAAPEVALGIVAGLSPKSQTLNPRVCDAAAPDSPLTLVEEWQAAQIGALQANFSYSLFAP